MAASSLSSREASSFQGVNAFAKPFEPRNPEATAEAVAAAMEQQQQQYYNGWGLEGAWDLHGAMAGMDMGMEMGMGMPGDDLLNDDYGAGMPHPGPDGSSETCTVPALSLRQPFASLVLYGVKQLEARNRPALKQLSGTLAIHVSHREEPFGSNMVQTAVALLRQRYPDEAIMSLFTLPQSHAQGHGCIVGLVDVEATWPADLFNEIEQQQLSEQV